jgi:hypothetical protein
MNATITANGYLRPGWRLVAAAVALALVAATSGSLPFSWVFMVATLLLGVATGVQHRVRHRAGLDFAMRMGVAFGFVLLSRATYGSDLSWPALAHVIAIGVFLLLAGQELSLRLQGVGEPTV